MKRVLGGSSLVLALFMAGLAVNAPAGAQAGDIVINEIHFKPASVDDGGAEFLELYNPGDTPVNLAGYTLDDAKSAAIGDTATLSGTLGAKQYAIIAPTGFDTFARWGVEPIARIDFGLGGIDTLTLRNAGAAIVDEVSYENAMPWPEGADETGSSLELIDASSDNSVPTAWAVSTSDPTPGAVNSATLNPTAGPITGMTATPSRPTSSDPITVVATVPAGTTPTLHYRIGFDAEMQLAMVDDGTGGDATSGDEVFTAIIPMQASGDLVRYRIEEPSTGANAPRGGRNYLGVLVDDVGPVPATGLTTMEWFIPDVDYDAMFHPDNILDREFIIFGSVLVIDGVVYDNMEVKIRGGTPARLNKDKQGLSFDFAPGLDADLPQLVTYPIDEFALKPEWGYTIDRSFPSWQLFQDAGFPEVQSEHVHVQRNGEFYGLFRFTEKLDGTWRDEAGTDGGFYKATSAGFRVPNNFEKKQPKDDDRTAIDAFAAGLNQENSATKTDYLYDALDIPNIVNYLAVANLVGHFDSEGQNFYVHEDTESTGLWQVYPWDLTNTFGVRAAFNGCDDSEALWVSCNSNALWNAVDDVPELNEMVWRRTRAIIDGPMADGELEAKFEAYYNLLGVEERVADDALWTEVVVYHNAANFNRQVDVRRNLFLAAPELPASQPATPAIEIEEVLESPVDGGLELLELINLSGASVDLSDWTISGPIDFVLPSGTVVPPNGYVVVTNDIPGFQALNPNAPNTVLVQFGSGDLTGDVPLLLSNSAGVVDASDDLPPLICNNLAVTVDLAMGQTPTEGDDVIRGTSGNDVINSLGGNDTICALQGDDTINGGDGFDKVFAGAGADTINGGSGNDLLIGGAGKDTVNGGNGNDRIQGGDGADNLNGENGLDRIAGGNGNDIIRGGKFADTLFGNLGRDQLFGDEGDDVLRGGAWIDTMDGGPQTDGCTLSDPGGLTETRVNCETGVFGR